MLANRFMPFIEHLPRGIALRAQLRHISNSTSANLTIDLGNLEDVFCGCKYALKRMPSPIEKSRIQGHNDETPEHGTQREHRTSKTDRRRHLGGAAAGCAAWPVQISAIAAMRPIRSITRRSSLQLFLCPTSNAATRPPLKKVFFPL